MDAVVIGGGFFGCFLANTLARKGKRVVLVESSDDLLTRASYINQARLHNGCHYPRSFRTAASSRQNMGRFLDLFEECVDTDFRQLYCIANARSKVGRRHFTRFCAALKIPLRRAEARHVRLLDQRWIEAVFETDEFAFDALALRERLKKELADNEVDTRLSAMATEVKAGTGSKVLVKVETETDVEMIEASWAFNCTYSRLNHLRGLSSEDAPQLKHQVAEVVLVDVPEPLKKIGVTVMDGPFFSIMPFPARRLHSFTHVRYTPHFSWRDESEPGVDPYERLRCHAKRSNFPRMVRDATRFLPLAREVRPVDSLFEVKTVLAETDVDDARPIVFHSDTGLPRVISILGGKLDNVFDVLTYIERELDMGIL